MTYSNAHWQALSKAVPKRKWALLVVTLATDILAMDFDFGSKLKIEVAVAFVGRGGGGGEDRGVV